ncbi:uncharacterized protein K452DRAFT_92006 [Aplosporella prunicola CBS 121167]|uniref:Uncharacterized protein n=1 Tax=Aplosporella prunicola CBS 121167 TaxID=1176127 RepID=A0A6A6B4L0_9PEZI|nr:uncharacterized protein K452DRAFT_92006 [Aplosporella prunicola CBS 121167]KAF2138333.1 hypothetical protein K452DRAFT_92006 [Aplosporella prunicola CBS 121167]
MQGSMRATAIVQASSTGTPPGTPAPPLAYKQATQQPSNLAAKPASKQASKQASQTPQPSWLNAADQRARARPHPHLITGRCPSLLIPNSIRGTGAALLPYQMAWHEHDATAYGTPASLRYCPTCTVPLPLLGCRLRQRPRVKKKRKRRG